MSWQKITDTSPYYQFFQKCVGVCQLASYLTTNHRLSVHQSGNKTWNSTETSLIHSTDSILKAIDQKKVTAVILLDMSKAFDSIYHDILLAKMKDVGVSSTCLAWFESYLSERYQAVRTSLDVRVDVRFLQ